ncbi:MAG: O-antigen ligase family protein [Deltaproteobacteria bacterium]|nr:O-antigen ligase family protein [Deltaproteobacteria bacterium]MBW1961419.1 O-antigen ligase family protein [Deltaproteobacteria bacterium]MBW2154748.1 O-antigen ligase family protein [Deltaproteobacteria bacterium]
MISTQSDRMLPQRLDKVCAIAGALVPVGLVMGNVAFESMIGLVGCGWLLRCIIQKERPFALFKHSLVLPWLAWLVAIAVSLFWNGAGSKGWVHDLVFFRYMLYVVALLDVSKRLPVERYLLLGFAAGVLWAAINTASAYTMGFDLLGKPLIRYTGKLKEASRISGMSAYAGPFFIAWGLLDTMISKKLRVVLCTIGLLSMVQLFQTHVRTAILAAVIGVVFCSLFFLKKHVSLKAAVALSLALIFSVFVSFHVQKQFRLDTLYDRVFFWKVAFTIWQSQPVLGVGISSFQDAYKEVANSEEMTGFKAPDGTIYRAREQTHAHNLFLMLMACTGLLGLAAFLWLFINAVVFIFRDLRGYRLGLAVWPVVFLAIGLTGFNIYHSWYQALLAFFIVLIGICAPEGREFQHPFRFSQPLNLILVFPSLCWVLTITLFQFRLIEQAVFS